MFKFKHQNPEMQLDKEHTALVFTDLQNEFLQPATGTYYELIEESMKAHNVPANIETLLKTAQELGYYVIHSPHWYYPTDRQWKVPAGNIGSYRILSTWKVSRVRAPTISSRSRST
jgi:nicotinamidase-related amidase